MEISKRCTGCMACYNSCKFGAINIIQDKKGFYIPQINTNRCKNCGLCKKVCPELNEKQKKIFMECYAGWINDKKIRSTSTSGGIFTAIANKIIEDNGVVIGAMFNDEFKVVHGVVKTKEELKRLQGSKYVQSHIGSIYSEVEMLLNSGKKVLFSGVSCQIAGLKNYLKNDYKNLITIDVLCHGAPSPKIFEEYLSRKNLKNINDIRFRYKKPSWTVFSMRINYDNRNIYCNNNFSDEYLRLFLDDYITNEVCSSCKYVGDERCSDITLADFWGYISDMYKYRNTEKGISLILINSEKGEKIIDEIKDYITLIKKNFEEAKNGNQCLKKPFNKNQKYEEFWREYNKNGYDSCVSKFFNKKRIPFKRKLSLFINNNAYLFPKKIRNKMFKYRIKFKGERNE